MIFSVLFLQPPQPTDLVAFQWVAIVTMGSIITALFYLLQKAHATCKEDAKAHRAEMAKIIELYHAGTNATTAGMKEVTRSMADMASVGRLQEQIERLEGKMVNRLDQKS